MLVSVDLTNNSLLSSFVAYTNGFTSLNVSSCPLMTALYCNGAKIPSADINTMLAFLVSSGLTGGTAIMSSQTPAAPPTVGPPNGIVAKAALLAMVPPWNVGTD